MNKQKSSPPDFIAQAQLQTIRLRAGEVELFIPDAGAVQEAYRRSEIPFPYWSKIWPSAVAMAEYLLLHPELLQDKNVLELGAGLGLPSILAARYAASVTCTDHAPEAIEFVRLSAAHNSLHNFHAEVMDWNQMQERIQADLVLLSDINYEPNAFAVLMKMISFYIDEGKTILLSTPQRLMAKDFINAILPFCKNQDDHKILHKGSEVIISVLLLKK